MFRTKQEDMNTGMSLVVHDWNRSGARSIGKVKGLTKGTYPLETRSY